MDVRIDDCLAVTCENNWFPGVVFNVRTVHQFLSLHPLNHSRQLFNVDRSFSKIS